jgi:hypothetical protein
LRKTATLNPTGTVIIYHLIADAITNAIPVSAPTKKEINCQNSAEFKKGGSA